MATTETPANPSSHWRETLTLLVPAAGWPRFRARFLRDELGVAFTGALIAIPQAIALAALAGLPPQAGFYASILSVVVAMLWGSSWHLVSGPNTAVSLMLAAAVAPLAAAGANDMQMILLLTFMVGGLQLSVGLLRLGTALDFVSSTVIIAVTHAVALILLLSSLLSMTGLQGDAGGAFFGKLWLLANHVFESNTTTLALGALVAWILLRFAGAGAESIPLLGPIPLSFSPWSMPPVGR